MTRGYSNWFYTEFLEETIESARVIVPMVIDLLHPTSVVDVGCGIGVFLSVFVENGVTDIRGLDGDWVDRDLLMIPESAFMPTDLSLPLPKNRRFDLVLCLEVAEHLSAASAGAFVNSLGGLGDAVLFSAAIPYQGGYLHINEQWQDYWADLFERRGFLTIDCIRRKTWSDARVLFWYSQNTLLFVRRNLLEKLPLLKREFELTARSMLPVVHPDKYITAARIAGGFRRCLPLRVQHLALRIMERLSRGG